MAAGAARWVWANSRAANGALLVLLAIADEADKDGTVEMSVTELARKTRLSDKGTRNAVRDLERLGELSVTLHRGAVSRYALHRTPAESTGPPRQNLPDPPADITGVAESTGPLTPAESTGPKPDNPQVNGGGPAEFTGPEISDVFKNSTGIPVAEVKEASVKPPPPPRPDVDRLCERLAVRIAANGSKRPAITPKWRDACRLMLDKDGRTEQQVTAAIDWCQDNEFWRANILSMPKLREKYDQLRLDAMRGKNGPARSRQQQTDDQFGRAMERAKARSAKEAGIDPRGNGYPRPLHPGTLPPAGD